MRLRKGNMINIKWWQTAVFYQIYPRSFSDGNGDGIGDLIGITERLDYLKDLGIDAVWLSPHFTSPQVDFGYDISDYFSVAPEYGNIDDFIRFLDGAHERGIYVILDLVLNHTSDQHPWFIESRSSLKNPKRNWYIWQDGQNGHAPNNWYSTFGGPAWELDPHTDQYYYHYFFKEQPDLNWRNSEVKQAMWEVVRFWLDLGVDGYRLDAIATIFEDPSYSNHNAQISQSGLFHAINQIEESAALVQFEHSRQTMFGHQVEQPGIHKLMQELRSIIDEYNDKVLIGENDDIVYHGNGNNELHMVFNFPLMKTKKLTPDWVRTNQETRLTALAKISEDAWPCNTFNNHDSSRVFSRFSDGEHDQEFARISIALLLTLRGTPFLYYGEEIGMEDLNIETIDQFKDPWGIWNFIMEKNEYGIPIPQAISLANNASRDKCRTPMQWSNSSNAGFSPENIETWLPINQNYINGINVALQSEDPKSLLSFYRSLIHFRKITPALIYGEYFQLNEDSTNTLSFLRKTETQTCLVAINMSSKPARERYDLDAGQSECLFTSHPPRPNVENLANLHLSPFEIFIGDIHSVREQSSLS